MVVFGVCVSISDCIVYALVTVVSSRSMTGEFTLGVTVTFIVTAGGSGPASVTLTLSLVVTVRV